MAQYLFIFPEPEMSNDKFFGLPEYEISPEPDILAARLSVAVV
jgi:hypothetical protein